NAKHPDTLRLELFAKPLYRIFIPGINSIDLISRYNLRLFHHLRIIGLQFFIDLVNILYRIPSFCRSCVYQMDQHPCPLNMTQELMAQPYALGSALNKPGNICNDKSLASFKIYHSQMGINGGEMIIGNLRTGIAHSGKKGGFSDVRKSQKAYICDHLQL